MKKLFLSIIALAHFGAQAQWTNVPSAVMTDISVGSASNVVGTNSGSSYSYWLNPNTFAFVETQTGNPLLQVSISADASLWAVRSCCTSNLGNGFNFAGDWGLNTAIAGNLQNISCRNNAYVIGTSGTGTGSANIYYSTNNGTNWSILPGDGALAQVSVGTDGTLYGIYGNYNGTNTYRYTANNEWAAASVLLTQISVGDAVRIVGRHNGIPYWLDVADNTLHAIAKPNGQNVIDIEVAADGTIYCLTNEATNNVYRTTWTAATGTGCPALVGTPTVTGGVNTVCAGSQTTLTAAAVTNATYYTWTLGNGWTGTSTTNTITVTAPNIGFSQLAATVTAHNDCFTSAEGIWYPTVLQEIAPMAISGSLVGCVGINYGYSVNSNLAPVTWAIPSGWSTLNVGTFSGSFILGDPGYMVVTKSNACFERSDSIYVNVYQTVPNAPILATGDDHLCLGAQEFVSFSIDETVYTSNIAITPFNHGWTVQADTDTSLYITPTNAGPVTIIATATNSCGTAQSTELVMYSNALPLTTYANFYLQGDDTFTSSGEVGINYQWLLEGNPIAGATNSYYSPLVSGNYSLQLSFMDYPCAPHTSASQYFEAMTVGVNEAATSNMSIYPNPFNTEFVIETTELTSISVMNAMGEVVLSRTINGRTSIDATTLSAGIYFVREETSGAVMKLVKN